MGLIPIQHVAIGFGVNDGFVVFDRRDSAWPKRAHVHDQKLTIERLANIGCGLMFDPDYKRQYWRDVLAELYKVEGMTPQLIGQNMAEWIEFDWKAAIGG